MKKPSNKTQDALAVRSYLQDLAKRHTETSASKSALLAATGISKSLLEQMVYHGKGGLDSWVSVLMYILKIDSRDMVKIVEYIVRASQEANLQNEALVSLRRATMNLSDDRKVFWSNVIEFVETLENPKPKKRRSRLLKTKAAKK